MTESTLTLCVLLILLVPFAGAGIALINTGLGRSRSAAHSMLAALCAIGVAASVYFVSGFAVQGFAGRASHDLILSGKAWNLVAAEPFFFRGLDWNGSPASLAAWLQMFVVGIAALIPLGAGSDRWRLGAICWSTALLSGLTYPLFAHWVWSGGWLAQLGANYGMGHGFIDAGGAGSVHAVGGLTALSIAWLIGPRRGKYGHDGMPSAMPGHNAVLVLFACLLALLGWIGLNGSIALLVYGIAPGRVVLVGINTMLSGTLAALAAAAITRFRFGRPDASLCANGWVGGLVASSAASAFVSPAAAAIVGLIAGVLVIFSVEWLDLHLGVDDPGGAISVHAVAGIWGLLAAGLFARFPDGGPAEGQWLAQLVGVATLIGFVLPITYGLNWILNRLHPHRVPAEGERQGMDLYELGAGAYPEFVTHYDEFANR